MKKTLLFAIVAVAMLVSCDASESKKSDAEQAEVTAEEVASVDADVADLEEPTNAPVVSGDVVYIDLAYLSMTSKMSQIEGAAFEKKFTDFSNKVKKYQDKAGKTQQSWQNKETAFANEAQKIQDDYNKSMITGITAQQKSEDLQRRAGEYQKTMQREAESLAKDERKIAEEEAQLAEEQQVLDTRFARLVKLAVDNVNADGRYKMVISNVDIINAHESLNISSLVLAEMDKLYEEGALD